MSENPDYNLVRQYLILSEVHQRTLNNYYETTLNFHQNTTNVLLQYMENRWFQDTRIDRLVSRNRLQATIRARESASRDISLNTSSSREISTEEERNPSINRPYHPFNRRRRVFSHSRPHPPQTMTRNTVLSPLSARRSLRNNTNLRNEIDNTHPLPPSLPRSPGGTLVPPPIRIPPPPPTEPIIIPPPPSANNEMTRLIDSPTNAQSNDTTDTITPNTRNRSNSMMERGMRRRSPNRLRSRRATVPFHLPNLVPTTTETDLINTPYDSPVRIRPSIRQIRNATEVVIYSQLSQVTRDTQLRCPIDIVEFSAEDTVLRIRHCGHIFREMNLRQHFRRNPRCPLCRFDIRDYVASTYNLPSSSTTPTSIRNARAVLARVNETLETNLNSMQNDPSANMITSSIHSRRRSERTTTHEE
ncbi:hypothetical protein [uncultured Mediterranean phage]|nr:hypothetical protein [uncultured Mediterranean phage]